MTPIIITVVAAIISFGLGFMIKSAQTKKLLLAEQDKQNALLATLNNTISLDEHNAVIAGHEQTNSSLSSQHSELQHEVNHLRDSLENEKQELTQSFEAQLENLRNEAQTEKSFLEEKLEQVEAELAELATLLVTFERWHESLTQLMEHNAEMHHQNQEDRKSVV